MVRCRGGVVVGRVGISDEGVGLFEGVGEGRQCGVWWQIVWGRRDSNPDGRVCRRIQAEVPEEWVV